MIAALLKALAQLLLLPALAPFFTGIIRRCPLLLFGVRG